MADKDLIQFNKIMHRVPFEQREGLVKTLDYCLEPEETNDDPVFHRTLRLKYAIYEAVKKHPRTWPPYAHMVTVKDVKNREFEDQIGKGIAAYLKASEAKRHALKKTWLNKWKPSNIISRLCFSSRESF